MASLHARHSRSCALPGYTSFENATEGCTCPRGPTYFVVVRQGRKTEKIKAGKNRQKAERQLKRTDVELDDGAYRPQPNVRFEKWGEDWRASLERKETTKDSYASTVTYATEVFGSKYVRHLQPADVRAFNAFLRERKISDSTRAKHLRVLATCLTSAVQHGYAARNPVKELPRGERPQAEKREAAYFLNDELPRLFLAVEPGVFRTLFLVALKTGMREGELVGLTWGDIDLGESVIHVRRTYTDGYLHEPKNHEKREVDLTPEVVELLGQWWGECGRPENDRLVFPGDSKSGYIVPTTILKRELYPAMVRADVPRVGPTGVKRTFHSFRHTFAKVALENGRQITWLSRHMGHSSLKVTTDIYGHWERATRKAQVAELEGAFGV
jgi:integrase